jgi:2-iminobutanoate/2-iminopropanoate deaminase
MKEAVSTIKAPAALGPYSQAIKVAGGSLLFCSGQIALDPTSGELVGETAAEQCQQVMENLKAVIEAAGSDMNHVVKTTIFLADINDFGSVNEVYGKYFGAAPPARATAEGSGLPKDAKVEIDAVVVLKA